MSGAAMDGKGKALFGASPSLILKALLLALALHLVLAFVFKPVQEKASPSQGPKRFTVMLNPERLGKADSYGLRYWLQYGDPTLFAKPDEANGFSSFRRASSYDATAPDELPMEENDKFARLRAGQFSMPCVPRALAMPPPSDSLFALSGCKSPESLDIPARYPLCLDLSGHSVPAFSMDSAEVRELMKSRPPVADTVLRAVDAGADLPLEIAVGESCGSSPLDAVAARTLALRLEAAGGRRLFGDDGTALFTVRWYGVEVKQ